MSKVSLDEVPALFRSGVLSSADAVNVTAEFVFLHPNQFGLYRFDQDFRSDIIVILLQHIRALIERFDPSVGKFSSYVFSFVKGLILTELRSRKIKVYSEESVQQEMINSFDEQSGRSVQLEIDDQAPEYSPCSRQTDGLPPEETDNCVPVRFIFHHTEHPIKNYCKCSVPIKSKMALVLALKSSYYLSEQHLSLVSAYCGINRALLAGTVNELNRSLETRALRREKVKTCRDTAYYFHRKYMIQLRKQQGKQSDKKKILERYLKQTANWQNKNRLLQKTGVRVCPTNKTIARLLGICERQVSYYMSSARKIQEKKQ